MIKMFELWVRLIIMYMNLMHTYIIRQPNVDTINLYHIFNFGLVFIYELPKITTNESSNSSYLGWNN